MQSRRRGQPQPGPGWVSGTLQGKLYLEESVLTAGKEAEPAFSFIALMAKPPGMWGPKVCHT